MSLSARVVVAMAGLSLAAAACSGQPQPQAGTTAARELRIGLVEYEVLASHAAVLPGDVVFEVTNAGGEAHDLRVDGAAEPAAAPTLRPGDTATLRVHVPAGQDELVLWCTLPGHRAQGMHTRLEVSPQDTENAS
ncbi:MAG: hypothetical protein ACRDU8_09320 [Egibacteraceae bacterium]